MLIGKGTTVSGEIGNCTKVELQGHLEGSLVADSVVFRKGGSVRGGLHAGHAEVHGVVDGEVTVEHLLDVRSTGRVVGELAYSKLSVLVGGDIVGAIKGPEPAPQPQAPPPRPPSHGMHGHASYSALQANPAQPPPMLGH